MAGLLQPARGRFYQPAGRPRRSCGPAGPLRAGIPVAQRADQPIPGVAQLGLIPGVGPDRRQAPAQHIRRVVGGPGVALDPHRPAGSQRIAIVEIKGLHSHHADQAPPAQVLRGRPKVLEDDIFRRAGPAQAGDAQVGSRGRTGGGGGRVRLEQHRQVQEQPFRLERVRIPVAEDDDVPVQVRAPEPCALRLQPGQGFRPRVPVGVIQADRDDCMRGRHGGQEIGARAAAAAVVGHFQDVGRHRRAMRQHAHLLGGIDVAREQEADLPVPDQQHHRLVVGVAAAHAGLRVQHVHRQVPPAEGFRVMRRGDGETLVRHGGRESLPDCAGARVAVGDHRPHRDVGQVEHIDQPAHVVAVGVRVDHHVNVVHALGAQVGHHGRAGVRVAAVDQHVKAVSVPQQDRVALAHVEVSGLDGGEGRPALEGQQQQRQGRHQHGRSDPHEAFILHARLLACSQFRIQLQIQLRLRPQLRLRLQPQPQFQLQPRPAIPRAAPAFSRPGGTGLPAAA
jgi:hypothetical protein